MPTGSQSKQVPGESIVNEQAADFIVALAFPFAADFAQAVGAHLELVAQALQQLIGRILFSVGLDGAGNVVSPLALGAIVNEEVLFFDGPKSWQRFRIDARPEERYVADVAMDIAAGQSDAALRLGQHVGDFEHRPAGQISHPMHRV